MGFAGDIIRLQNFQAGYGDKIIVDLPEFSLKKGEHCLILGNSGAGKTTLLFALAGLLKPLRGQVWLGETEVSGLKADLLDEYRGRNIGIIYQTLHLIGALTILQNLLIAQYSVGLKQDVSRARELLEALGIGDLCHHKPNRLSHGQQQRVAIARAALNHPQIILGDEPTSALDDVACDKVMQILLQTAQNAGATLIIATHDARIKKYFSKTLEVGGRQ